MKILHTSDWHLGSLLYGYRRAEAQGRFLEWFCGIVRSERPDVLVIAGDVFDTGMPSAEAQRQYYAFLSDVAGSGACPNVVVTSGNHDSATLLDAPAGVLEALNVHVVGHPREDAADEVFLLRNADGVPVSVVCAVPYLREGDVRRTGEGDGLHDRERRFREGVEAHYRRAVDAALALREREGMPLLPIIAMGHLFASGATTYARDGEIRYVGALGELPLEIFPKEADYVALGHIHRPQRVGAGPDRVRYCGSPVMLAFGEAQDKVVLAVECSEAGSAPAIREIPVPSFEELHRIKGPQARIVEELGSLVSKDGLRMLAEVRCTDTVSAYGLNTAVKAAVGDRQDLVVLRVIDETLLPPAVMPEEAVAQGMTRSLGSPADVFDCMLDEKEGLDEGLAKELRLLFHEAWCEAEESAGGAQ